jgi:sporulation protein YqfC
MRSWTKKWNQFATQILDVPPDLVNDIPRITMFGNERIYIENVQDIHSFSSEELVLRISSGRLKITGKNFMINSLTHDVLHIQGLFFHIAYLTE